MKINREQCLYLDDERKTNVSESIIVINDTSEEDNTSYLEITENVVTELTNSHVSEYIDDFDKQSTIKKIHTL